MARRAEVCTVDAPLERVWAGLVLYSDPSTSPVADAKGNPGHLGSSVVYRRQGGEVTTSVMESSPKHYVRYRQTFSGWLPRFAFLKGKVEADYEVKASRSSDITYLRAVVDYDTPQWPTAIALLAALASLIGMNSATTEEILRWSFPVALFLAAGIVLQYVPRVLAHRLVSKPVMDRLHHQAASDDFHSQVVWHPGDRTSVTGALDLGDRMGATPHTAHTLTQSIPKVTVTDS